MGNTALIAAAEANQTDTVQILLDNKADGNASNLQGRTALMFAAGHGNAQLCNVLLKAGADTSMDDTSNKTAQSYAESNFHDNITKLLAAVVGPPPLKTRQQASSSPGGPLQQHQPQLSDDDSSGNTERVATHSNPVAADTSELRVFNTHRLPFSSVSLRWWLALSAACSPVVLMHLAERDVPACTWSVPLPRLCIVMPQVTTKRTE